MMLRICLITANVLLLLCDLSSAYLSSGHIGCLFSASVCHSHEQCHNDHLFGTCHHYRENISGFKYNLSGSQLTELYNIVHQLSARGYTWHHPFTQCVLAVALTKFQTGFAVDSHRSCSPRLSDETTSWTSAPQDDSNNVDNSVENFQQFVRQLSSEDLQSLKEYLLEAVTSAAGSYLRSNNSEISETGVSNPVTLPSLVLSSSTQQFSKLGSKKHQDSSSKNSGGSDFLHYVDSEPADRIRITLYVLFGITALLIVVFIILFYQYCRTYRVAKQPTFNGFVGDDETSADEYEDLCRQHMGSKLSEKPVAKTGKKSLGKLLKSGRPVSRSSSINSMTPLWQEDAVAVEPQLDMSTGTLVLSYMEQYVRDADQSQREWNELANADDVDVQEFSSAAYDPANAKKNRYSDVLPYEKTRVLLSGETAQYINASFIVDDDPRKPVYIATQGPLSHTIDDFWQMVWDQGSLVIVCLTCLIEDIESLCCQYWPDGDRQQYASLEVVVLSSHTNYDDFVIRNFTVRHMPSGELRNVTHFQFLSWPCTPPSVPQSMPALLDFRRRVGRCFHGSAPVIVHCSNGSGRTGTYCLIDMVLNRIVRGAKQIDVAATLEHLRDQRCHMVQTREQYEFALAAIASEVHQLLVPSAVGHF